MRLFSSKLLDILSSLNVIWSLVVLGSSVWPEPLNLVLGSFAFPALIWSAIALPIVAVVLLVMSAACRSLAYGWEMNFGSLRCEMHTHSVPDAKTELQITTLKGGREHVRHCIYDHEDALPTIMGWLITTLKPLGPSAG